MIKQDHFSVDPWSVTETSLDLELLAQSESVFALSNGHIGLRGNLDEGEPVAIPGSYLAAFFESRPLPYAEAGYGFPEMGQTVVNITNGKIMRLLVDDEPFDVRYGEPEGLTMNARWTCGPARWDARTADWIEPGGPPASRSRRAPGLSRFTQRADGGDLLRGHAFPDGRRAGHHPVRARSPTRPGPADVLRSRGSPRCSSQAPAVRASTPITATPRPSSAITRGQERPAGRRRRWTTWWSCPANAADSDTTTFPDSAKVTVVDAAFCPRERRSGWSSCSAYGWSAERSMEALRDQVDRRARRRPPRRASTVCSS